MQPAASTKVRELALHRILRSVRIAIVHPHGSVASRGNRTTAVRIADLLRPRHDVVVATRVRGRPDALIALHAGRSAEAVAACAARAPDCRLVVLLTGTDVYGQRAFSADVHRSLDLAWRVVVAQPRTLDRLPAAVRPKTRCIGKSVDLPAAALAAMRPAVDSRTVLALAHLRAEKDPLLLAAAMDRLPTSSSLVAEHCGAALDPAFARHAEEANGPRWRWLGEVSHARALRRLATARAFVLTSRAEGAPNALAEALALHRPVLASRIDGAVGMLTDDHPGLFAPGSERELAKLLRRVDEDAGFVRDLARRSRELARSLRPARERAAWERLLREPAPQ